MKEVGRALQAELSFQVCRSSWPSSWLFPGLVPWNPLKPLKGLLKGFKLHVFRTCSQALPPEEYACCILLAAEERPGGQWRGNDKQRVDNGGKEAKGDARGAKGGNR